MNIGKTMFLATMLAAGVGCGYSKPSASMPAISELSPASVTAGTGQFQLEVVGSNFASAATINFNGIAESTTVVNSTKLQAIIPGSAVTMPGTILVTVTNPGSSGIYNMQSVTSAPMNFTID